MTKKDIDIVCWWIPFKKTRNAFRSILLNQISYNESLDNKMLVVNSKISNLSSKTLDKFNSYDNFIKKANKSIEIINELKNFIINENIPVHVSSSEKLLFDKYVRNSKKYLEFGCGGSTFHMLEYTDADVISVESDKNFIDYISKYGVIKNLDRKSRLKFYHIDIGEIKSWGWPLDYSKHDNYPNYSKLIFSSLDPKFVKDIDTVFVDGRFRVACVLSVLLNCNKNVTIIIHDFTNRDHYHILLNFIEKVESADTLVVFRVKQNIDLDEVHKLLEKYQYVLD